jgi:hypothetical protein
MFVLERYDNFQQGSSLRGFVLGGGMRVAAAGREEEGRNWTRERGKGFICASFRALKRRPKV